MKKVMVMFGALMMSLTSVFAVGGVLPDGQGTNWSYGDLYGQGSFYLRNFKTAGIDGGGITNIDPANVVGGAIVEGDPRLTNSRAPTAHDQGWSTITGTPTDLLGYGITDVVSQATFNSAGILSNTIYVAKNGNDAGGNGGIIKPFLTVQAAMNTIAGGTGSNYRVIIAPGVYTENVSVTNARYLTVQFNNSSIKGAFDVVYTSSAIANYSKIILVSDDARPAYSPYRIAGIEGNVRMMMSTDDPTPTLHLNGAGVTGNITFTNSFATSMSLPQLWLYNGATYKGTLRGDNMSVQLYAWNADSSGSTAIGGAAGHVVAKFLSGVNITAKWNLSNTVYSTTGGWDSWHRVDWGNKAHNFAGVGGLFRADPKMDSITYDSWVKSTAVFPTNTAMFSVVLTDVAHGILVTNTPVNYSLGSGSMSNTVANHLRAIDTKLGTIPPAFSTNDSHVWGGTQTFNEIVLGGEARTNWPSGLSTNEAITTNANTQSKAGLLNLDGGATISGKLTLAPSATQTLTNGSVIDANASIVKVQGATDAVAVTVGNGILDGQKLVIIGQDDANRVNLTGTVPSFMLGSKDSIAFIWDGATWIEQYRKDN